MNSAFWHHGFNSYAKEREERLSPSLHVSQLVSYFSQHLGKVCNKRWFCFTNNQSHKYFHFFLFDIKKTHHIWEHNSYVIKICENKEGLASLFFLYGFWPSPCPLRIGDDSPALRFFFSYSVDDLYVGSVNPHRPTDLQSATFSGQHWLSVFVSHVLSDAQPYSAPVRPGPAHGPW